MSSYNFATLDQERKPKSDDTPSKNIELLEVVPTKNRNAEKPEEVKESEEEVDESEENRGNFISFN